MDTHERLRQLLNERGWSEYKLAKRCGLSESTVANIFRRNTVPSIATLETICSGFGITMSQFFAEGDMIEITPELKELFENWVNLTPEQKKAANQMLKAMNNSILSRVLRVFCSFSVLISDKVGCSGGAILNPSSVQQIDITLSWRSDVILLFIRVKWLVSHYDTNHFCFI